MDYKELNKNQKKRMEEITNPTYVMQWEDPKFMDLLMGALPKIRKYQTADEIKCEVSSLENLLLSYDTFTSDKSAFLDEIKKKITAIRNLKESWYGLSIDEIKACMKLHRFCLISGEGGIGKSYFIKCFEEQLEQKNISHLCIYGKFEKNTDNIDVEEIIEASNAGFVFVVDAINEMSKEGQLNLLDILKKLKKYPIIRLVISYRTNSMDNNILKKFQDISEYEYKFQGVSFESALSKILKLPVPDVYLYEDILYSNNALLLSMLCDVLSSKKIVEKTEKGIASITFILEQYIKNTINKSFKDNLKCQGVDIWEDIKEVAQWIYRNGKKYIDEDSLLKVVKTGNDFLSAMMQMGFMEGFNVNNENIYHFLIDSLTDFLIARSLFKDISGKEHDEQVNVIKSKIKSLHNLEEALIIAIFDNMSPNYKKIDKLLRETGLARYLNYNTIVKVHFKHDDIKNFLEIFKLEEHNRHDDLLKTMGGYTDKPFNCSNYLFEHYCASRERICNLSNILAGYHFQSSIKNRLKNVLYFTTLNDRTDRRDEEAYYFAILCCAAPNKDVRCLAMKLLYEVVSKNEDYVDKVISDYEKIPDFYIQEAIIYALSQLKKGNSMVVDFYNKIIKNQDNLTAKSIRRISTYLGNPYSYITWSRKNLFKYDRDAAISDYLNNILIYMNKDFLPFKYRSKNHIDMYTRFLKNGKHEIEKINHYLREKYSCVYGGKCSGTKVFEERIMPEIQSIAEIETMDKNSFMNSFEKIFRFVFDYYNISADRNALSMSMEDFHQSTYMKCVDIATGLYYGSLMCNYYTDQFATYDNDQNSIGYEVYDPLKYGEDVFITSPIPTYQKFIERLGDYVINSLEIPDIRDANWVRDAKLTRKNVLQLLKTININHQEWVMLAGSIMLQEKDKNEIIWSDTYDFRCCSSDNETIKADGNARYLTIELQEYIGALEYYPENTLKPWLCKRINNISIHSGVFDDTLLVLPPSDIISFLNLKLNVSNMSWEKQNKEKVIVCNNNKKSYYTDRICGTVFIRKDYFDKFLEEHVIKYFVFTERFIQNIGYPDETSLHFEIVNGQIKKEIKNY